ncbi:MAG TPA: AraC family transcriptional regulator [Vineibacter sp.]|nr:AraC family transcriptional regulator [Vineibacter sp.]
MANLTVDRDWVRYRQPRRGIETLRAHFTGHAFDRHAHETLAIGQTDSGVQRFRYRGRQHDSTEGGMIVLHPGEPHDGECGADGGFTYRMVYLDPGYGADLLLEAGLRPQLPFAPDPVTRDVVLRQAFVALWEGLGETGDRLRQDEALVALWRALARGRVGDRPPLAAPARLVRVRDALADAPQRSWSLDELAAIAGISRFALCRAFRRAYGVTPYSWMLARRLARARRDLAAGMPAAESAVASGFVDQSHLARNLKRHFGMAPGRFARIAARVPEPT